MPSEAKQLDSKLAQPWKEWHADLDPMSIKEVREGTLVLSKGGASMSGNHGTTALQKKQVDFNAHKEKPIIKVCQYLICKVLRALQL